MSAGSLARRRAVPVVLGTRGLEGAAALVLTTTAMAVVANAHLLRNDVLEGDAMVHQFWMHRWVDPTTTLIRGTHRMLRGPRARHVGDRLRS